ncbi:MAG: hypothetical protein IJS22_03415 [Lachnospiraceae bacterium]|nr:hypothetical protein [Lachnospiraceae bacterium]
MDRLRTNEEYIPTGDTDVNSAPQDAFVALAAPIGKEAVLKASQILLRYKQDKANLDNRIVENERWYRLRHWSVMEQTNKDQVEPTSAWLFNSLANKHADMMDNYPSPNVLPREEGDKAEAKKLTSILPVVLEQNDFEEVYDQVGSYKLRSGTGVYGIFWDSDKLNGLGDISIRKVDVLNLFWESGITDIQASRNVFHVELCDNDILLSQYPQTKDRLSTPTIQTVRYFYDDNVDTTEKSAVIDWYYKKRVNGRTVLHYCKYVNDVVLYASENDPKYAERGFYDHGLYPFVFDVLFQVEGMPAGFGYVDVAKSTQEYIDRCNKAIMQNTLANAKPRYFVPNDSSVNEEEFADTTKSFVHVQGQIDDRIKPIDTAPLPGIFVEVLNSKIEELKETTGNRDVSTGGTASGVTAAAAIAAMQEAGSKLSRDANKSAYRAYRRICLMVIELIRQFYDTVRCFRIMGDQNAEEFVMYSNAGIAPQPQGTDFGVDMGMRIPLFDIQVTAQKASPYSQMAQNEMAIQFYQMGFFNPQMADQALACLEMMDFDRKSSVMQIIQRNGTMYQQLMMMQQQMMALGQMVDQAHGNNEITQGLMAQFGMAAPPMPQGGAQGLPADTQESSVTSKARQRAADSTAPR